MIFHAIVYSDETGETTEDREADNVEGAISSLVAEGYEVITITDEDDNEHSL
jgi:hypothetical protein